MPAKNQSIDLALLNKTDVLRITSLKHTTLYELIKIDQFPRPVRIRGTRRVAWRSKDVNTWIASLEVAK